jgi:cobalt/nickel transport protein
VKKDIIGWLVLILITPLGLLAKGAAWGEWGLNELKQKIGFIPQGTSRYSFIVKNFLADYSIPGFNKNFCQSALGYIFTAVIGVSVILLVFWLAAKLIPEKNTNVKG